MATLFDEVAAFVGYRLTIDLERQVVIKPDGSELAFEVEPFRKYCLLGGFDDIAPDAAPRRQDPRLRGRAAAEAAVARARRSAERAAGASRAMKIAILPGDGIGTEIVAQAERVLAALDLRFETEQRAGRRRRLRGARPSAARSDARAGQGGRRGAVRRRRRLEVRHARARRCAPSRRSSACARRSACSPTSGRRSATRSSPRRRA